ncbi:hypothetical protein [Ilumatobacter sp.]
MTAAIMTFAGRRRQVLLGALIALQVVFLMATEESACGRIT